MLGEKSDGSGEECSEERERGRTNNNNNNSAATHNAGRRELFCPLDHGAAQISQPKLQVEPIKYVCVCA
jgi:hypothetical protein